MIFVGFGFLMTFLKHYSYSALGLNFFCSCVVILEALLVVGAVQQARSLSQLYCGRHVCTQRTDMPLCLRVTMASRCWRLCCTIHTKDWSMLT